VSHDEPLDPRDPTTGVDGADPDRIADDPPKHTYLWVLLSGWLLSTEAWLRSHGDKRLRRGIRGFWTLIAIGGVVLLFGPVINPPLTLDDITSSASTATETWIARDFAVDYTVDLADDGTLRTEVEERITAFFPDDVDERGIERVIAIDYEGHDLEPSGISATLGGEPIEVEESASATRLTLTVDTGERLQGDHEFVLRYSLNHLAYDTTDRATGAPVQLLEWDIFGPSWPHAVAGIDVRVSVPDSMDDRLVRQPRGIVAWSIVSAGDWLTPEPDSPAGRTVYAFSNDQNIPPNAGAWFSFVLEPGTVMLPPRSPLFWVQTFGPLAPLAFLLGTLLMAIAARAVAWSDARGRPWFVAQSEPPRGISVGTAAHILRSRRSLELAEKLAAIPGVPRRAKRHGIPQEHLLSIGHAAQRSGRFGNLPRALRRYVGSQGSSEQFTEKLRRIPSGFVRDTFIGAPLALTIVQWGLVRQLSYQAPLAIVWWPVAFVLVSTVLAVIVLAIALSARPLTRKGALAKQHLRGIHVFAERTLLLERGTLREDVLPYAVLTAPAREAGAAIAERVERELGGPIPRRSWHTADYLTVPRLAIRGLALLVVAGAITVASVVSNPLANDDRYVAYSGDVPGSLWTQVEGFSATAELRRGGTGHAELRATETLDVLFEEGGSLPPQVVRQWLTVVDGQQLDVRVDRVLIDGAPVDHVTERDADTLVMRTTMTQPLSGNHELRVEYTVGSAAVAAIDGVTGEIVDRVRWAALIDGWKYDYGNSDRVLEPLSIEITVADDLVDENLQAGWITLDTDSAENARDWEDAVIPFGEKPIEGDAGAIDESSATADGMRTFTLEIGQTETDSYPWRITMRDLGAMLDFPAGTFAGPDEDALRGAQAETIWPPFTIVGLGVLALLLGLWGLVVVGTERAAVATHGPLRDMLRWLVPALALATCILFVWLTVEISASHSVLPPTGFATVGALIGATIALIVGWRTPKKS
jgi:hypothetical protein